MEYFRQVAPFRIKQFCENWINRARFIGFQKNAATAMALKTSTPLGSYNSQFRIALLFFA
jgi:hypothetical protein